MAFSIHWRSTILRGTYITNAIYGRRPFANSTGDAGLDGCSTSIYDGGYSNVIILIIWCRVNLLSSTVRLDNRAGAGAEAVVFTTQMMQRYFISVLHEAITVSGRHLHRVEQPPAIVENMLSRVALGTSRIVCGRFPIPVCIPAVVHSQAKLSLPRRLLFRVIAMEAHLQLINWKAAPWGTLYDI